MHVEAKRMATAGLLVAFSVIMMLLSSVFETSSLFFIAAASFCVGIAVREWGIIFGLAFFIADAATNFLLAPNKMYCFTLVGMGFYIWASEFLWKKIADAKTMRHRTLKLWIGKYLIFNLLYVPVLFFAPQVLFAGKINGLAAIILLLVGQAICYIYDVAYRYFQAQMWGKFRKILFK